MEEELWPNTCCQEAPKRSWKGKERCLLLNWLWNSFTGPTAASWGGVHPVLFELAAESPCPMLARSPLVSQLQQDYRCESGNPLCPILEPHQYKEHTIRF